MATAGMMNEAYFTGRKEIVAWIQGKYQPNLQRVEDLCTGAVYCQIIDSIYPNSVQLGKVKFQAKTETDFIHNFKVLQAAFVKNKLDRCAPRARARVAAGGRAGGRAQVASSLVAPSRAHARARGWCASHRAQAHRCGEAVQAQLPDEPRVHPVDEDPSRHDGRPVRHELQRRGAVARRGRQAARGDQDRRGRHRRWSEACARTSSCQEGERAARLTTGRRWRVCKGGRSGHIWRQARTGAARDHRPQAHRRRTREGERAAREICSPSAPPLRRPCVSSRGARRAVPGCHRCAQERDFYFGKLRDIEILCQTHEDQSLPFLQNVLSILYQTEDDFVTPTDAEPLSTEA